MMNHGTVEDGAATGSGATGDDAPLKLEQFLPYLLMVVASDDTLAATDVALAAFERAGAPKSLELIEGHHFVPYDGEALTSAATRARDFFIDSL